ncbi:SusC/RagA family TonB-linked outer membrane protein [Rudanella paleaurantiibacter]|uniref:SusC/RagA family TonB-linked outer membrane protein n=1 Tax=Rudanella paleaurantiibacter TaxID=2614655 RepID=A0A7J5U560_9BACT|nr:TonB-dependent receptor [Rudanella paleaurantiibacter]KAB7732979.1 SusC/RagA family TonB-linked outer membrane protein [Rudanella paleaurantiibacter]
MNLKRLLFCGALLPVSGMLALPTAYAGSPLHAAVRPSVFSTDRFDVQVLTITGQVTDEKGEGLPGASVSLKGSTIGANTDAQGNYTLRIPDGTANPVLVISYIGYAAQEVAVGNQTVVNVQLKADAKSLNEVVVVGYGTQKRSDITGAVASVPKARLSQLPVTNVLQAVQGAVAGVNISQSSSVPGTAPSTIIRGQNSINANSGPYVVVDGIPLSKTGGSLNDINPNDIESIEILKDASAVAIYGTNGANGVILITTKRGTTGKPTIRYSNYAGVENFAHILRPRNGEEYVQKYKDYMTQTGQKLVNPVPNFEELSNYNAGITTDWIKEATQTGVLQDHNLSISGGTSNVRYFISGEYLDQKGVIKGYQYKRASFRSNLDVNVTDFLTVGTSLFIANNNRDGGRANLLNATAMSPYGQEYNANGTYKIYPMFPEQLYTNPMLGLTTDRVDRNTNLNGNGYAEVKFSGALEGLKFRLNAGYSYIPARTGSYVGRSANDLLGTANTFFSETNSFTLENILTYTRDWGKHHFDFTGLYSAQQRKYATASGSATGFVNDELSFYNLGAGATQSSNSFADRYGLNSQMGRVNYSYDSRYLFTLTARRDGSSVFGANTTKYGLFPSAALGWNISNEAFMKNATVVSNLKLRLSYGKSGNEAISVYRTITTNNTGRSPFNGVSTIGALAGNLGNANLQWETTLSRNIGLDFGFLNNRINGSLELYKNNTKGLLLLRSLPIITGYSSVFDNLGETSNTGIELTLNTRNVTKGDLKWESGVVFASNRNRIIDLYGDQKDDLGNRWFIGQPISVVYDYKLAGVWQVGEDASSQDPGSVAGDLKFADLNGDKKITPDGDRMILGQTAPKWTGGLTNTFHYKNFHLNVFIQTVQGITRNNADLTYADETGKRNTPIDVGYWTAENKSNTRPSLAFKNPRGYGYASDASFTRIKDVTLSYVFGAKVLDKLRLGNATIYVSGRNLYTFTNWIGWDPEAVQQSRGVGDWANNYPLTRSFVMGLNLSLR